MYEWKIVWRIELSFETTTWLTFGLASEPESELVIALVFEKWFGVAFVSMFGWSFALMLTFGSVIALEFGRAFSAMFGRV